MIGVALRSNDPQEIQRWAEALLYGRPIQLEKYSITALPATDTNEGCLIALSDGLGPAAVCINGVWTYMDGTAV